MGVAGGPKKTKLGKTRLDKFYHLAKEQGFRSRASFKLIQLNKKYDLLSKSKVVLDLCAAPGSWAQVCAKTMPINSLIIAVDLVPIKPIPRVICLQEDITTEKCRQAIKTHLKTWKVDLVLNDGAPNVGANWSKDAYTQSELTLLALKLGTQFLTAGGTFVTKVFRSQDYNALLWTLNQLFQRVEATKPTASRNESAEIFVVCIGYLAPKKIDPKLLDPKHIFEELDLNPAKKANVMQLKKETRHRDGYDHGATMLYKEISATTFVTCEDALDALTVNNKIVFDKYEETAETDKLMLADKKTTEELLICCGDLRVLGKADFRKLLRWRDAMKEVVTPKAAPAEESEEEDEETEESRVAKDIASLAKSAAGREKRAKRKEREKKAMYQRRVDMKMDNPDDVLETQEELGLFSTTKSRAGLIDDEDRATEQADNYAENPNSEESESEEEESEGEEYDEEGSLAGPRARRLAELERQMDGLYESYCERTGTGEHARKRKNKRSKLEENDELGGFVPDLTLDPGEDTTGGARPGSDEEEEEELDQDEAAKAARAERWFSQDLFSQVATTEKGAAAEMKAGSKKQKTGGEGGAVGGGKGRAAKVEEEAEGFEEVAVSESDSDSESDLDSDGEAEVAAMGQLLLKKKIRKEDLIDACYHKYSFNDVHLAPQWFQDQEKSFLKPQVPVTKAMIEEEKERNMAIAARPIKKVMEAKARKKIKAVRANQKLSAKMDGVVGDSDTSDKAKMRALQKLYDKGVTVKRPRAVTVMATKGKGKAMGKKGTKVVDKRMKKDGNAQIRTGNRNFKGGAKGSKTKTKAKVLKSAPAPKIRKRKGQ